MIKINFKISCILFWIILFSGQAWGKDQLPLGNNHDEQYNIDESRELVASKVVNLARSVDSLFGDDKIYDDYESSTLILEQDAYVRDRSVGSGDFTLRLNLKLPNAQSKADKVGLVLEDAGTEVVSTAAEMVKKDSGKNKSNNKVVTTPKRKLSKEDSWKFSQQSGIRVAIPLYSFFKLRARKNFKTSFFANSFSEEFGWYSDNKWVENTTIWSDIAISDDLLFRIVNEKNWFLSKAEFETIHGFSFFKSLRDNEAVSFNARVFTDIKEAVIAANRYTVGFTHSRAINREWVTLETTPQLVFLRENGFKGYWEVLFRLGFAIGKE